MSGARQRGTTGQWKSLESAEAGYANPSDALPSRNTAMTPSFESTRLPTSNTFIRRRKANTRTRASFAQLLRAKLRRMQLKGQRHGSTPSLCMTVSMGMLLLVGVTFRYFSSSSSSYDGIKTRNPMSVTRHLKSFGNGNFLSKRKPMTKETTRDNDNHQHQQLKPDLNFEIVLSSIPSTILHTFHYPSNQKFKAILGKVPDRGGLELVFYEDRDARRFILRDNEKNKNTYRDPNLPADDDMTDPYYYFDDDYLRGLALNTMSVEEEIQQAAIKNNITKLINNNNNPTNATMTTNNNNNNKQNTTIKKNPRQCRRIAEHTLSFPNCNDVHELDRLDPSSQLMYLNEGSYRQVFAMVHRRRERIAIKDLSHALDFKHDNYEFVRMDAIVAERLTASPRTFDIYGYCGVAIVSEYFYHGDIELDVTGADEGYIDPKELHDQEKLNPQNNLTGIQKLVLSLEMAEALADLHGYANGLIVHDDVQLSQFLFNKDKTRLKLNDFNRAEFPLFDENNQEYCRWKNGPGYGNWRSPEEYQNLPLTEQIDVWSLGNNMYTLLTGLNPLYDEESSTASSKRVIQGETAFIDPRYRERSRPEAILADLIQKCFAYQPEDRPSIFEIVDVLRVAVKEHLKHGMTRAKVLKGIKTEL